MSGKQVDLARVTRGSDESVDIPHAAELLEFAEAVVINDAERITTVREILRSVLGEMALVDAAATVAAFHGFVRLADSTGIPYTTAAKGSDAPEIRSDTGVNEFYRVREDLRSRH